MGRSTERGCKTFSCLYALPRLNNKQGEGIEPTKVYRDTTSQERNTHYHHTCSTTRHSTHSDEGKAERAEEKDKNPSSKIDKETQCHTCCLGQ
eukprot:7962748-Ditylum_brightwellii.AAC.1